MTLEALGNIGELLGGVAVLVSLVYLAFQIRQNTRTMRSATHQAWVTAMRDTNMLLAQSREFSRVYRIGCEDPDKLELEELTQFNAFNIQMFNGFEALYFQFINGAVDATYWSAKARILRFFLERPGVRSWWDQFGGAIFDPRFQEAIKREVLSEPGDLGPNR